MVPYVTNSEGSQKALRYRYASAPHWDNRMVRTIDWKKVFISHAETQRAQRTQRLIATKNTKVDF